MLNEEYIFKDGNKFIVQREINGNLINFGSFDTLEDAVIYRDELDYDGWPIPRTTMNNKVIEDNIEKIDENKYIVFRFIDNEKDTYGPYDSIESARRAKYNLKSTGWESDLEYAGSKYGKYIRKSHNRFIVSRTINKKYIEFGVFDSLEEAQRVRDDLILNNWGIYNIKSKRGYGKYISKLGDKFRVSKNINGKLILFGSYDTLEEATLARDKFESENWENIPENVIKFNRHIISTPKGFGIYKRINGELKHFGTFKTFEEALTERDRLITNNWQLYEDEDESISFDKNIQFDGNYFTIERFVYNELRIYGVFKNKDLALKEREKLKLNYWRAPYRLKTKKYPYGENIVPFDYLFNVEIYQNDELKEFGPFYNFGDAVKKCNDIENEKIESNNLLKDSDLEINSNKNKYNIYLEIYNNIEVIPEPEIPFPQADVFEIFIEICEKLYQHKSLSKEQIMDMFEINPRQYNFYISAGEYLGLINPEKLKYRSLNQIGLEVFSLNIEERNLALVKLILQHKPFHDVFKFYLDNHKVPTSDEIFAILKKHKIYNVNSDVTLKRRSTSVRSWINWIVNII